MHDRAAQRPAKLIQAEWLLRFAVGGPPGLRRVEDVVANELEEATVKLVGARGRHHGQLCATRRALLCGGQQRIDAELRNRVQRDGKPCPRALGLVDHVGRVHAVVGEVAVVQTTSGETDRSLVAAPGIDRAGDIRCQR